MKNSLMSSVSPYFESETSVVVDFIGGTMSLGKTFIEKRRTISNFFSRKVDFFVFCWLASLSRNSRNCCWSNQQWSRKGNWKKYEMQLKKTNDSHG